MVKFQMIVLGVSGMYTRGDLAASEELAKLAKGSLLRTHHGETHRLGIHRYEFEGDEPVLVAAESKPEEWRIGKDA